MAKARLENNVAKDTNKQEIVDNVESFNRLVARVKKAQQEYSTFSQEKVDAIFKAAATAANKAPIIASVIIMSFNLLLSFSFEGNSLLSCFSKK